MALVTFWLGYIAVHTIAKTVSQYFFGDNRKESGQVPQDIVFNESDQENEKDNSSLEKLDSGQVPQDVVLNGKDQEKERDNSSLEKLDSGAVPQENVSNKEDQEKERDNSSLEKPDSGTVPQENVSNKEDQEKERDNSSLEKPDSGEVSQDIALNGKDQEKERDNSSLEKPDSGAAPQENVLKREDQENEKDNSSLEKLDSGAVPQENVLNRENQENDRNNSFIDEHGSGTVQQENVSDKEGQENDRDDSSPDKAEISPEVNIPQRKYSLMDFTFLKVLGKGAFGKVMLAEKKGSDQLFAVKTIVKKKTIKNNDVKQVFTERRVLALASGYPFLTALHSAFQTADRLFLVMEFVRGGELMSLIVKERGFGEKRSCFYAAEVILGLRYLHGQGIIYRDLKGENILVDEDGHIKLADFGLCKEGMGPGDLTKTFVGSPAFLAPEVLNRKPYGFSVDWWSLGVLMYLMMLFELPFPGVNIPAIFDAVLNEDVFYPLSISWEAFEILQGFLTKDCEDRLGCTASGEQNIVDHAYFREMDWVKLEARQIEPPFKPIIQSRTDVKNFDSFFTREDPVLSLLYEDDTLNLEKEFNNFTFTRNTLAIA